LSLFVTSWNTLRKEEEKQKRQDKKEKKRQEKTRKEKIGKKGAKTGKRNTKKRLVAEIHGHSKPTKLVSKELEKTKAKVKK